MIGNTSRVPSPSGPPKIIDHSVDIETPAGIGNVVCSAVLEFRHHDGSNQLGDLETPAGAHRAALKMGAYDDWSDYLPLNSPNTVPARIPITSPLTQTTGNLLLTRARRVS